MTWGVRTLQAVWWTTQPIQADPATLYQDMVGVAANSTQSNPATSTVMANGPSLGMLYNVQRQPNRLDFFASREPEQGTRLPIIDDIPRALGDFRTKLNPPSRVLTAVNRLAIVVNVSRLVDSMSAANQQVAELTGIDLPFGDTSDLLLQVNRRSGVPSIPNLQLNRVLKWLAETFQIVEVVAGAVDIHNIQAVTVSVDINTVPVPGRLFQTEEQGAIFEAMASEAERLCLTRTINALAA